MVLKVCTGCEQALAGAAFSQNRKNADGLQHQCKGCNRAYYEKNKARIVARVMAAADPEQARQRASKWYAENKERAWANGAIWRADNKDRKAAGAAKWAKENPEKRRQIGREWSARNPEHTKAKTREYRARKRGADGSHTAADVKKLLGLQRCRCAICKADISSGYHVDHVMPLALGGSNDKANIQLLCQTCNTSKGAKHPVDFMQKRGYLL
jgi:5-methylcytosine-specific restriction endonuclease McrA